MLVLTRGLGERFVIGDDIVITVVRVHGDSVSLGFRCPDALSVDMKDVHHGCLKPQRHAVERSRFNVSTLTLISAD